MREIRARMKIKDRQPVERARDDCHGDRRIGIGLQWDNVLRYAGTPLASTRRRSIG